VPFFFFFLKIEHLFDVFSFHFHPLFLGIFLRDKSYCEKVVATSQRSSHDLTELRGLENKYVAVFSVDPRSLLTNKTFPFNPGYPTVINLTLSQVHSETTPSSAQEDNATEGVLLLLDNPSSVDIGPVAPGGEYRISPFNPPDITYAIAPSVVCTTRTPFSRLFGQYQGNYFSRFRSSPDPGNKVRAVKYSLTLADAK
jgi:hypothetical protein